MAASPRVSVEVEGRALSLSNLDKVLYPEVGFTKGQVIDYYTRIAPAVLPHLRDRALTLKRYPNGVEGHFFYEKQAPSHRPDWVRTARIEPRKAERSIDFCVVDDLATLVWTSNLADLELHPSLAKVDEVSRPSVVAFDLDPGEPATIVECCGVALDLRERFATLGLEAWAKTSGSKGMQVYVPLNDPDARYAQTKPFAHAMARLLAEARPDRVLSEMTRAKRTGKVFVDWSQNDEHKTTVGVYSLRAKATPTVSTPITWEEVEAGRDGGDPAALSFTSAQVLERVEAHGDLWADVLTLRQSLPDFGASA